MSWSPSSLGGFGEAKLDGHRRARVDGAKADRKHSPTVNPRGGGEARALSTLGRHAAAMFACLALLSYCANGWAGSIDPVAQGLLRHMAHRARHARLGDWISYRTDAGGGRVSFWRLSAVGAEKDALGRDALWIELELGPHEDLRAPLLQMKMLVARGEGLAAEGITRLFVALGADPPQEIPPDRLHRLWPAPFLAARVSTHGAGDEIIRTGEEVRLMTRAGTLPAVPVEIYQRGTLIERIWMSHRLPLLGLAKLEMPAIGHVMEITGFGTDAAPRMIAPERVEPTIRLDGREGSEAAQ